MTSIEDKVKNYIDNTPHFNTWKFTMVRKYTVELREEWKLYVEKYINGVETREKIISGSKEVVVSRLVSILQSEK